MATEEYDVFWLEAECRRLRNALLAVYGDGDRWALLSDDIKEQVKAAIEGRDEA
jgi:hypothetical protein